MVDRFLYRNGLKALIRGHESYPNSQNILGRVITLHTLNLPIYGNPTPAYLEIPPGAGFEHPNLAKNIRVMQL